MSYDQALAEAEKRAAALVEHMKWATTKLGGHVDDKWDTEAFKATVETAARKVAAGSVSPPPGAAGKVQLGPVEINATEREVAITFSQEKREFATTGPKGMIMFVLVHDLKNKPSSEAEISSAMQERGWSYPHNTLAPELGKLVKIGDLIKESERPTTYRLPGKLNLTIDGKKV
jgi:hypothetical protein